MEAIEKTLGKKIIRIETNDLDEMEEVRAIFDLVIAEFLFPCPTENEEGVEVIYGFRIWIWIICCILS